MSRAQERWGDDRYLKPEDVAEWLNVTKDWVYDAVERDLLPCRRLGKQLRFHKGEIQQWLDSTRSTTQGRTP